METVTYTPKHLRPWAPPRNWFGQSWHGWYAFLGQHRDSPVLERSNFDAALTQLKALGEFEVQDNEDNHVEGVYVVHESHWAVGWVEWIAIYGDHTAALQLADSISERLQDYPVVDEDHYYHLERDEALRLWASLSYEERKELCQRFDVPLREARRTRSIPQGDALWDYLASDL